jgi:cobalt-zinc-cadmium efflux system membrane fusion protein
MIRLNNRTQTIISNKELFKIMLGVLLTLFISGCGHSHDTNSEENVEEQHDDHEAVVNTVELTPQQYKAIGIELGSIEQKNLSATLKTTGFLKVPPQNKANISAPIGGMVQSILVREGEYVQKGQPVLSLMNPEFVKMQQEYLSAKAQLAFAEADYNRQKELSEQHVASQKNFQQVTADFNSLKATVNSLQQQLSLLNINATSLTSENISAVVTIKSPISGSISHIDINIGSNVDSSKPLMDVVDNKQLHVDLFVFEQDLPKIKEGQQVDLTLINMPGKNFTATIFAVGNAFESETKTIPVHAEITGDKKGLIEGMNITAFINTDRQLLPAVLSSAIINNGGNDFIFIEIKSTDVAKVDNAAAESENHLHAAGETKTFERIQVKRGITNGNYTGITSLSESLPEHTNVVTNGAFYLMAMLTNVGEEGHEH